VDYSFLLTNDASNEDEGNSRISHLPERRMMGSFGCVICVEWTVVTSTCWVDPFSPVAAVAAVAVRHSLACLTHVNTTSNASQHSKNRPYLENGEIYGQVYY